MKNIFMIPDQLLRHEDLAAQRTAERVLPQQRRADCLLVVAAVDSLFIFVFGLVVSFVSRRRRCRRFDVKRSYVRR